MTTEPKIMEKEPKPRLIQRFYYGRQIPMWRGVVNLSTIEGWAENPRITLARNKWLRDHAQEPDQNEIYEIMKSGREIKLNELRDDILRNGLREPVVLTHDGRLLDGNRRFFAIRFALESLKEGDTRRAELEKPTVFALMENCTLEDQNHILVEENFAPALKEEWPDYVKALHIKAAKERHLSEGKIAKKFGWTRTKVRDTVRTLDIIAEFESFALDRPNPEDESGGGLGLTETETEDFVNKRYQYFNEAQKSFYKPLEEDPDFKLAFFRWLYGDCFTSFHQARIAYKAWHDSEAKETLEKGGAGAGKDAKTAIDNRDREARIKKDVDDQIRDFLKFLNTLEAKQLASMPLDTRKELQKALQQIQDVLERFDKMAKAASD